MSYGYGGVYTKEAIDLTNYAEIQVTFLCKKNLTTFPTRHYLYVGVDSDMADITTFDKSKKKYLYDSDDTDGDGNKYLNSVGGSYTMSLDVSSLSGAYYIKAGAYAGHYYKNAYEEFRAVTKIELIE